MGDRASIKFKSKFEESPVLCAHWEGVDLFAAAKDFTDKIMAEAREKGDTTPLYRLEPGILLIEFVRTHFSGFADGDRVTSSYYLGKDRSDVDDSDNGCLVIDVEEAIKRTSKMYRVEA